MESVLNLVKFPGGQKSECKDPKDQVVKEAEEELRTSSDELDTLNGKIRTLSSSLKRQKKTNSEIFTPRWRKARLAQCRKRLRVLTSMRDELLPCEKDSEGADRIRELCEQARSRVEFYTDNGFNEFIKQGIKKREEAMAKLEGVKAELQQSIAQQKDGLEEFQRCHKICQDRGWPRMEMPVLENGGRPRMVAFDIDAETNQIHVRKDYEYNEYSELSVCDQRGNYYYCPPELSSQLDLLLENRLREITKESGNNSARVKWTVSLGDNLIPQEAKAIIFEARKTGVFRYLLLLKETGREEWKEEYENYNASTPNPCPLIVGVTKQGFYYLLGHFNLTAVEQYIAREFTQ